MAVLTCGEILAFPAVSTFVNDRASNKDKGKYQGIVQSVTSAGRALGPLIGALVIDNFSYLTLFVVCTVLVLIYLQSLMLITRKKSLNSDFLFSLIYKKSLIPPTSESGSHSVRYRYSDQIKDTFSLP